MCNENLTCYGIKRYCVVGTYCILDNIYKLGYIVVSWLNIICIYRPSYEPPTEGVVKVADAVKAVGDAGVLQGEVDVVAVGNLNHGQIVD